MKTVLTLLAAAALGLTVIPPCLVYLGSIQAATLKPLMLAGTVLWFLVATPLAALRERKEQE